MKKILWIVFIVGAIIFVLLIVPRMVEDKKKAEVQRYDDMEQRAQRRAEQIVGRPARANTDQPAAQSGDQPAAMPGGAPAPSRVDDNASRALNRSFEETQRLEQEAPAEDSGE